MKRISVIAIVCLMCFALVGCGKNDITLTKEQNDLIAEYIAGTLLKYSYDNEWKMQKLNSALNTYTPSKPQNEQKETSSATKPSTGVTTGATTGSTIGTTTGTTTSAGNTQTGEKTDPLEALPQLLGMTNVDISYKSYTVADSYPEGSYILSVPANQGCKIVAVEFTLKNNSAQDAVITTKGNSVSMKLSVSGNGEAAYSSMLKNDLLNLNNFKINAGSSEDVFVLFMIDEADAASVAGSVLSVSSSGASVGTMTVK